ncbi:type II toxin-antitoxin system RelE family toxin [Kitasatospora putterlickiae]
MGDHRVIYTVDGGRRPVLVVRVCHRSGIYRD